MRVASIPAMFSSVPTRSSAKSIAPISLSVFFVLLLAFSLLNEAGFQVSAASPNSDQATTIKPVIAPTFTSTPNAAKKSKQDEVDILPPHYYKDVAPIGKDGKAVKVTVSLVILNIKLSQGSSQTFDADLFYHNYWTDHRLQKPTNEDAIAQRINLSAQESLPQYKLGSEWRKRLWCPDTYFRNAIAGGISNILTPTYYFTITNYTEVFMAVRLSLKLSCEMNFAVFPFDTQRCFLNISMTSEDINTVRLEWDMFRVGSHVDVSEFQVVSVNKNSCSKYLDIGIFSCLYGEIVFKRNIGNYMIKRFIPSSIIVLMSFLGYWIPTALTPARISLNVTALLALITQQIQSDLNVSYVYALQVWNICCIVFVFANLLEFAIALYVMHMSQKKKGKKKKRDEVVAQNGPVALDVIDNERKPSEWMQAWQRLKRLLHNHFKTTTRHSSVDYISRYIFPVAFLFFVLIFAAFTVPSNNR